MVDTTGTLIESLAKLTAILQVLNDPEVNDLLETIGTALIQQTEEGLSLQIVHSSNGLLYVALGSAIDVVPGAAVDTRRYFGPVALDLLDWPDACPLPSPGEILSYPILALPSRKVLIDDLLSAAPVKADTNGS